MKPIHFATLLAAVFASAIAMSAQSKTMTIVLTGQSMIRSDLRSTKPAAVPIIKGLLNGGDVVFTNLEGAIAEPGQTVQEGRGFLAPAEALDALKAMGFNLLSLSNNHAFDLKEGGVRNTLRELDRRNIAHAGTGNTIADAAAPAYFQTPKGTVALVASASGLIAPAGRATAEHAGVNQLRVLAGDRENEATADLDDGVVNTPHPDDSRRILQSIRDARQRADVVIVYQHNHVFGRYSFSTIFTEGMQERLAPNPWLTTWTHDEIDAGADIVVMHGAPLLHGVEMYRGRPIFYDLGNFIYNLPATLTYIDEPMAWESVVASVEFDARTLKSISLRPVVLNPIGDGQPDVHNAYANNEFLHTRGLPTAATGARANHILQRVSAFSKPYGTSIDITGEVANVRVTK
ncbi:MAG TPA: CapA family protein [Vicinamibacterales bacterium]|jgi:poly-gamma-glutamate synthesis protein (capsule biosynthesis protein)